MYLIPIAWLYVALMMSVAEATNSNGTVMGAIVTFVFYGLLPVGLIWYFITTPARKRALRAKEAALAAQAQSIQPNAGGETATDPVAPVGKEP